MKQRNVCLLLSPLSLRLCSLEVQFFTFTFMDCWNSSALKRNKWVNVVFWPKIFRAPSNINIGYNQAHHDHSWRHSTHHLILIIKFLAQPEASLILNSILRSLHKTPKYLCHCMLYVCVPQVFTLLPPKAPPALSSFVLMPTIKISISKSVRGCQLSKPLGGGGECWN